MFSTGAAKEHVYACQTRLHSSPGCLCFDFLLIICLGYFCCVNSSFILTPQTLWKGSGLFSERSRNTILVVLSWHLFQLLVLIGCNLSKHLKRLEIHHFNIRSICETRNIKLHYLAGHRLMWLLYQYIVGVEMDILTKRRRVLRFSDISRNNYDS